MGPFGIYDDDDDIITEFHRHLTRTSANTRSTPKFDTMARKDKLWQTLGKFLYPKYYKHSIFTLL